MIEVSGSQVTKTVYYEHPIVYITNTKKKMGIKRGSIGIAEKAKETRCGMSQKSRRH